MMVVSFLPALCYYIGYSLLFSGMFGGQQSRNNNGGGAIIGIAFMAFSWVLNLFTLYISRLREYYADRHSVSVVDNGADKLSTGLAKIVNASARTTLTKQQQEQMKNFSSFKSLFIANPETAKEDSEAVHAFTSNQKMVEEILDKKLTFGDKLVEALSTHPNIVKRLRALQELKNNPNA
jgi:heat shock protein HtpX